jgi:hypothetical protein
MADLQPPRPDRAAFQRTGPRDFTSRTASRAEIVLLTADGLGTNEIMRRTAKSKTCV